MNQLQLAPEARLIGRQDGRGWPTQDGRYRDLLRSAIGEGNVFRGMAVVDGIRLNRQAITEILDVTLHPAGAAGQDDRTEKNHQR